jgi:glucokinase
MNDGFPRLLGDIGGTHARWAWQPAPGAAIADVSVVPCAESASLFESAQTYLAGRAGARPASAGIGIATSVTGDHVQMTNHPWSFSIEALRNALGVQRCLVINDFTAMAMSLPALGPGDLLQVGAGTPVAGTPIGLLGPGTGLGVSALLPGGEALAGEGGHVTLAANDEHEMALLGVLHKRFGHVSAERVLSGSGLVNLYEAICTLNGAVARQLSPAEVTADASSGADAQCVAALAQFVVLLGSVAGNLALTLGARGGVYIGGGIVPRLGATFDAQRFRQAFENKGRFGAYLRAVPTWIITAQAPALLGAARALDRAAA